MDATELALLAGVCAEPADDAARLVYADRLDENNDDGEMCVSCPTYNASGSIIPPDQRWSCTKCFSSGVVRKPNGNRERAELIRTQVAKSHIPDPPPQPERGDTTDDTLTMLENLAVWRKLWSPRYYELRDREKKLLVTKAAEDVWPATVSKWANKYGFSRGFLSSLTCSAVDFFTHADELVWRPDQTMPCVCKGAICHRCYKPVNDFYEHHSGEDYDGSWSCKRVDECQQCDGSGRIQRPCPPTAQPIEEVTFTDWPLIDARSFAREEFEFDFLTYRIGGLSGTFDSRELCAVLDIPHRTMRADEIVLGACAIRFRGVKFNLPTENPLPTYNDYRRATGREPIPGGDAIYHSPVAPPVLEIPKTGWTIIERRVETSVSAFEEGYGRERYLLRLHLRVESSHTLPPVGTMLTDVRAGGLLFARVILTDREYRHPDWYNSHIVLSAEAMPDWPQV